MRRVPVFVVAALVCLLIAAAPFVKKGDSSILQFGELVIAKTGVLSIADQSARYLLVPEEKYPAELRGIAVIDLDARIYVARFFEPSGTGVEGFFDVCFRVKDREIVAALVENAGSLEPVSPPSPKTALKCWYHN